MPSYAEILEATGLKSKNAVFKLVKKMVDRGLVQKDARGRLIPGPWFRVLPVIGFVEAGFPSPAEEELGDTMSLDDYLIENREATYLFKVKGDSMVEAGILPGDLVLVQRGIQPQDGDIIIAEVDSEWTLKFFRREKGKMWLEPANKNYPPIHPRQTLKIAAVVKAVIRKY